MKTLKDAVCAVVAVVVIGVGGRSAQAGEISVNNLSNESVWLIMYIPGVQNKDSQCAGADFLKTNDVVSRGFSSREVYVRILKGDRPATFNFPTVRVPFCDQGPFTMWTTEDPKVLTLKWAQPGQQEQIRNWRKGTPLPPGWSFQDYYRVPSGRKLELLP